MINCLLLKDGRVFCRGGNISGRDDCFAYLLRRDGAVETLPRMQTPRRWHGAIQVKHVYIFGGGKL